MCLFVINMTSVFRQSSYAEPLLAAAIPHDDFASLAFTFFLLPEAA